MGVGGPKLQQATPEQLHRAQRQQRSGVLGVRDRFHPAEQGFSRHPVGDPDLDLAAPGGAHEQDRRGASLAFGEPFQAAWQGALFLGGDLHLETRRLQLGPEPHFQLSRALRRGYQRDLGCRGGHRKNGTEEQPTQPRSQDPRALTA